MGIKSSIVNRNRLIRSRLTGVILIGIMGFLVIGIVFQPVASSISNVAPQTQFEIPIPENIPPPVNRPEINPDATVCVEESTEPECIETTEPEPEQEPITSDDTVIEQIIDETKDTISDVVLPDIGSKTLTLVSEVSKIDSTGFSTVVTKSFDVIGLSFFVEDESNRDFENGFLEIKINIKSPDPQDLITGSSTMDILIGNQTIFTEQIPMTVSEISGVNGTNMEFISPTGTKSDSFTFSFADNLDKFPVQGVTKVEVKINNLNLELDSTEQFGATSLDIFSMNIATDPDLVIVQNEEGETQRIYPKDISFKYHNSGRFSLDGTQCRGYNTRDAGTIEIFDSENTLLQSGQLKIGSDTYGINCGRNFNVLSLTLDRDTTYRLVHTANPTTDSTLSTQFDVTFTTPKSQKNYSLQCFWGNLPPLAWNTCSHPSPDGSEIILKPVE